MKLLPLALCVNKFTHTRLLAIFNGSSVEISMRLLIAKGDSPPRAEGQRCEAQRVAEQCLEKGGMMFERSEFLPPQALRQAASGEVWTDWKMSQSDSWICKANRQYRQQLVVRSADIVCTARDAERRCCQLLSTECRTRLPCFWYFFKKVQKERVEEKYKWTIKVEDCCRIWRRAKASFLSPNAKRDSCVSRSEVSLNMPAIDFSLCSKWQPVFLYIIT